MIVRSLLGLAVAGGIAFGSLAGVALRPTMHFAPLRPWQGEAGARPVAPVTDSTALASPTWAAETAVPPPRQFFEPPPARRIAVREVRADDDFDRAPPPAEEMAPPDEPPADQPDAGADAVAPDDGDG